MEHNLEEYVPIGEAQYTFCCPAEAGEALLDTKVPEPSAIAPLLSEASTSNDAEVSSGQRHLTFDL